MPISYEQQQKKKTTGNPVTHIDMDDELLPTQQDHADHLALALAACARCSIHRGHGSQSAPLQGTVRHHPFTWGPPTQQQGNHTAVKQQQWLNDFNSLKRITETNPLFFIFYFWGGGGSGEPTSKK